MFSSVKSEIVWIGKPNILFPILKLLKNKQT